MTFFFLTSSFFNVVVVAVVVVVDKVGVIGIGGVRVDIVLVVFVVVVADGGSRRIEVLTVVSTTVVGPEIAFASYFFIVLFVSLTLGYRNSIIIVTIWWSMRRGKLKERSACVQRLFLTFHATKVDSR